MTEHLPILLAAGYLALATAAGFAVMGIDKRRAVQNGRTENGSRTKNKRRGEETRRAAETCRASDTRRRIPEKTLFLIAAAGGSVGVLLGMYAFRHKTRHLSFVIGVPVILALQIGAVAAWWFGMK